ncbi:hypothetical protein D5R81_03335 [Parashewanella spongiae]|uniref:Uncharacterized protein n=1 Tax=Parashewanella spongiae TaxID=342950 RepID=A0A3A6U473_9GAMM|nr:tetratricopeptide repeat protein [Parashewanella spongiae]MCL1078969.1 tetratricopeptide repeat protein [Parashewanella spongiae]RJY18890.1 hypothetical protein D5R81_03335 [Parashewanella spongiae]
MAKFNKLATALLLSFGAVAIAPAVNAADKCPIELRKSKAMGQSTGKKIQKAFKAYGEDLFDESIAILLEANPKNDFDKASVARFLGNLYAQKEQYTKALNQLKLAADTNVLGGTEHADTLRAVADLSMQDKNYKQAIEHYEKWMTFTCKSDVKVYTLLAVAHVQLKQWDDVIVNADKAIAIADKPIKDLYNAKVNAYFNKKQNKNAIKVLETAVQLFDDDGALWRQLAQFYLATENYKQALATYDLAYKAGFLESASDITRLAQLLSQGGSGYKAAKVYNKHLKSGLIEKNAKSFKQLAVFYQSAKEFKLAADNYGEAAALDNDPKLYLKQGQFLTLSERYGQAVNAFNKALKANIKNRGAVHVELGRAYLELKQYKSAYKSFQLAMKDKKSARTAKGMLSYVKEKAKIHKVSL